MDIQSLDFEEVKLITPKVFYDTRGFFLEAFHKTRYAFLGEETFPQDNLSYSKYGTLRGMHFQTVPGQAKFVQVVKGRIFDVFVDIRKGSPSFGKWQGIYLDDEKRQQLFLPVGFAHGFCCMSEEAYVLYKVSSEYRSETERGFRYDDPQVGIQWPLETPILSDRDLKAPFLEGVLV
ncbi:MAG: dTDP-4-dehydrorhamnose 3,5-epimerase [Chlamydiae bacterium]|nr:dTDP-4-dehydrorhamnose 3,5-epimerase [Chlamydiota bacterium]